MRRQLRRTWVCLIVLALLAGAAPVPASAAGFQDVPDGYWAAESIQRSVDLGFLQGQSVARFGVGGEMSRSTFAVVLCRFYGWKTAAPKESSFQDVPASAEYAGAVEALLAQGVITKQRPDFRPDAALTREDLAVMLVRSLGYSALAGLVQELPSHFQDLHTNAGYIAMAYNLGLMNGTSADAFSPSRPVLREEVAVTLVRLYDKLHTAAPEITAVVTAPEEGETVPDMTGLDIAAIAAGRLTGMGAQPAIMPFMTAEEAASLRSSAKKAGAKAFLYVTGGPTALNAPAEETAAFLARTVADEGYDGLLLDMPQMKRERRIDLTQLVKRLRAALGETPFYLLVEAPTWNGVEYGGYDYTEIAAVADQMILRVSSYEAVEGGEFPIAPVEPLEEIYYALVSMKGHVELGRLSVLVTLTPTVWDQRGRQQEVDEEEAAKILASGVGRYSQRYGCAYAEGWRENTPLVVWYLDQESVTARRQMVQAFGIHQMCLSNWREAPLELLAKWK